MAQEGKVKTRKSACKYTAIQVLLKGVIVVLEKIIQLSTAMDLKVIAKLECLSAGCIARMVKTCEPLSATQ